MRRRSRAALLTYLAFSRGDRMLEGGEINDEANQEYERLLRKLDRKKLGPETTETTKRLIEFLPLLRVDKNAGKVPPLDRETGQGEKGELWVRNRLHWLRCIPMKPDGASEQFLVILSREFPVFLYRKEEKKHTRKS